MERYTDSTGAVASPLILNKVLEAKSPNPLDEKLKIHRIEVGNSSGADAQAGWGIGLAQGALKVGSLASAVFTESLDDSFTVDTALLIASPIPLNAIKLNVSGAAAGAGALKYYNGSSLAAYVVGSLATLDLSGTGLTNSLNTLVPSDQVKVTANALGLPENYYVYVVDTNVDGAIVDSIEGIQLVDYLEIVADGNALVNCYDAGKVVSLNGSVYSFISTANANNFTSIEYTY